MNVVVSLKESRESVLVMESLREWVRSLRGVSERCCKEGGGEKLKLTINYDEQLHAKMNISLALKCGSLTCTCT